MPSGLPGSNITRHSSCNEALFVGRIYAHS